MMGELRMNTTAKQQVIKTDGAVRLKPTDELTSVAVRVRCKTKSRLEHLLRKANKDRLGKKVKIDDLILFALGLITDTHLADICSKTLSNKDRMELLYRKLSKEKRGITRDDFFGMLLDGKVNL